MERRFARYPFLHAAREYVAEQTVDLTAVIEQEGHVVERARERVIEALTSNHIGDAHRDHRIELLAYPIARILVSLVDEQILIRKYARAEATAAYERFTQEFDSTVEFQAAASTQLRREELLEEFDLVDAVNREDDEYQIDIGAYLPLAAGCWGDSWRLVNRPVTAGVTPVTEHELDMLLREAVRDRVESGLPFDVPDEIAVGLEADVAEIRAVLNDLDLTREIDTVVPELFPPCMQALLDRIHRGDHLAHHSRFAITAFLTSIGMSTDDIVELYRVSSEFGEEMTRYQTDHIRGETSPTSYSPPSCATMKSYGDCVNMDELCERISHPLGYYEQRLEESDEDDIEDWRETMAEEST